MMKLSKALIITLLIVLIASCSTNTSYIGQESDENSVCVGTFNLEWLGDGIKDQKRRTSADYKQFAQIIVNSGLEIVGIQEVENSTAIEKITKYLPEYKYIIGNNGGAQNVGILYKNTVEVKKIGEYSPLEVVTDKTRPGLIVECRKGNFDWVMMVVHLKSTSRYDDTPEKKQQSYEIRRNQAEILKFWADSVLEEKKEEDIFIVGDFNDNPKREDKVMYPLTSNKNLTFLSSELKSCKNPLWDMIDHVVVSKSSKKRYLEGSIHSYNYFESLTEIASEGLSDHCPVMAIFDVNAKDND